jgi:Sap, sulfolipid-1-addressing protein
VGDLVRALVIAGLLSGTQPITIMGLLLVMSGANPRRNGRAYLLGCFTVETTILVVSSLVLNSTVTPTSGVGRTFLGLRIALGVALILVGLRMRRPPKKEQPEVPKALERLQNLSAPKSFIAAVFVADYQGPVIASLAISTTSVGLGGRFASVALYTLLATGIPFVVYSMVSRSVRGRDRVTNASDWVMRNRRMLASWILILLGLFVASDALVVLLLQ